MSSNEEWGKEADPRRFFFGHSLYRRIVSMADALKCRAQNDETLINEIHATMDTLVGSCVMANTTVHKFKYALQESVELHDGGDTEARQVVVSAQVMDAEHGECYMFVTTQSRMYPVNMVYQINVEATNG